MNKSLIADHIRDAEAMRDRLAKAGLAGSASVLANLIGDVRELMGKPEVVPDREEEGGASGQGD